jgi:hypothetical protein
MADIKRTWTITTSPRSPHKLPGTLELLAPLYGRPWDKETQHKFGAILAKNKEFEGDAAADPAQSARDRVGRALKAFGFVRYSPRGGVLKITDAGSALVKRSRLDELYLRQMLKWQFPSPNHGGSEYAHFNIKPFLEVTRLVRDLDGLSKKEINIFCLTLIDWHDYDTTKAEILEYRSDLAKAATASERRATEAAAKQKHFRRVYAAELASGDLKLREQRGRKITEELFLAVKVSNAGDYADAVVRYVRATELFNISSRVQRLKIAQSKTHIVDSVLKGTERDARAYSSGEEFLDYLCNPTTPEIPQDSPGPIITEIKSLSSKLGVAAEDAPGTTIESLKDKRDEIEERLRVSVLREQSEELASYSLYGEITSLFSQIANPTRSELQVLDRPTHLEWNTWRALTMLDDGDIRASFPMDSEGKPMRTAPAGLADIICYYKSFVLVVEVTTAYGATQYIMEGEPVPRHLGKVRQELREAGDLRPVYGLFVALRISPDVVTHFYNIRQYSTKSFGGKSRIIPLDIQSFMRLIEVAKERGGVTSEQMYSFIRWADARADSAEDEQHWIGQIHTGLTNWPDVPAPPVGEAVN